MKENRRAAGKDDLVGSDLERRIVVRLRRYLAVEDDVRVVLAEVFDGVVFVPAPIRAQTPPRL